MKRKLSKFIDILNKVIKLIFSLNHYYPKSKELTDDREGKLLITLDKCYRCNGTGTINRGSRIGENIPSRFDRWGSNGQSPYITCPVCKGTGRKEILQPSGRDKEKTT